MRATMAAVRPYIIVVVFAASVMIMRSWYVTQTCPVRWAEVNAVQTRDELVVVEIAGRRGMILAVIWAAVAPPRQL